MTVEDYQRNLRGVNEGTDFSPEYLVSFFILYSSLSLFSSVESYLRLNKEAGDRYAGGAYRSIRVRVRLERAPCTLETLR